MKNIIKTILAAAILLNTTSCLKDDELIGPDAPGAITNIVEFGNVSTPISGVTSPLPVYSLAYDIVPSATLDLPIKVVGAEAATSDTKVVIELNNALVGRYNDYLNEDPENEIEYAVLPSERYAVTTTEVTIKKGERVATIPVQFKPSLFTFDKDYAIGFTIKSASNGEVSGNFGNIVINVAAKNPYDGTYNYRTSANTSLVPNANKTVQLVTVGPNRVKLSPGLLGTYSNEVYYNVDPITNMVTVECPSLGVQTPQDTRSKWDPATKTLKVYWKQGNGGRTFEETFTYTGSR